MPEEQINGVVITFFSTASAVGKTLISINMASELAREGYNVCLVDFDLQFGDVANYLQLMPEYTVYDINKSFKDNPSIRLESMLTTYRYNGVSFQVMPAPVDLAQAYNINPDDMIELIKALRQRFEYVIIDTTSMFSVLNLAMLDLSTIVTFLGIVDFIPTIKNMKIGNDTLRTLNYDSNKIRLVLNRSNAKTRIDLHDVEELLGDTFYHILPNDYGSATNSIATGVPVVLEKSDSELSQELRRLVARYTNRDYQDETISKSDSWLSRIFR